MIIHSPTHPRRRFAFLRIVVAAALLLTGAVMAVYAASPQSEESSPQNEASAAAAQKGKAVATNDIYIVQMRGEPVATYRGGVSGLRATAPAPGRKIDTKSAEVMRYTDHLRAQHDALVNYMGLEKVYSYTHV
ncbi:MAG TPA: hypothetical protein VF683_00860, partial [Chthoniobacterales bacterium]